MANAKKQVVNYGALEAKNGNVNLAFQDIISMLEKIEASYQKILNDDMWIGPKSVAFTESLKTFWRKDEIGMGIIERITEDKEALSKFVETALERTLQTDTEAALNINSAPREDGVIQ